MGLRSQQPVYDIRHGYSSEDSWARESCAHLCASTVQAGNAPNIDKERHANAHLTGFSRRTTRAVTYIQNCICVVVSTRDHRRAIPTAKTCRRVRACLRPDSIILLVRAGRPRFLAGGWCPLAVGLSAAAAAAAGAAALGCCCVVAMGERTCCCEMTKDAARANFRLMSLGESFRL